MEVVDVPRVVVGCAFGVGFGRYTHTGTGRAMNVDLGSVPFILGRHRNE